MTKKKNISYIPYVSKDIIERTIKEYNAQCQRLHDVLASHNEDISEAILYQQRGVDWKRKEVIQGCKDYIERTQMPEYLQTQALKAAHDSCDNRYISQLAGVFGSFRFDCEKDIEVVGDKWVVAQHIIDKVIADHTYTLSDKEMDLFVKYMQMITIAEELHKEYYYFGANIDYNDELQMLPTEEENAERFIACGRATPEEYQERIKKYPML